MINVWLYLKCDEEGVDVHDERLNPRVIRFVVCEVILKIKVLEMSRSFRAIHSTSQMGGLRHAITNLYVMSARYSKSTRFLGRLPMFHSLLPVGRTFLYVIAILIRYNLHCILLVNRCRREKSSQPPFHQAIILLLTTLATYVACLMPAHSVVRHIN